MIRFSSPLTSILADVEESRPAAVFPCRREWLSSTILGSPESLLSA